MKQSVNGSERKNTAQGQAAIFCVGLELEREPRKSVGAGGQRPTSPTAPRWKVSTGHDNACVSKSVALSRLTLPQHAKLQQLRQGVGWIIPGPLVKYYDLVPEFTELDIYIVEGGIFVRFKRRAADFSGVEREPRAGRGKIATTVRPNCGELLSKNNKLSALSIAEPSQEPTTPIFAENGSSGKTAALEKSGE